MRRTQEPHRTSQMPLGPRGSMQGWCCHLQTLGRPHPGLYTLKKGFHKDEHRENGISVNNRIFVNLDLVLVTEKCIAT